MISLDKCKKLLTQGYSLIAVNEDKRPLGKWKEQQTKALTEQEFEARYNQPGAAGVGIVTGYNDLECVDMDLKVFSTAREQKEFWCEYTDFLNDNILDFHEKFVVYKTRNNGYHILFKTKRVEGNQKLAVLKGHRSAIIETRGVGGQVVIYDGNNVTEKTYSDIDYVSDEDRDILFCISKSYNYTSPVIPKNTTVKEYIAPAGDVPPWDEFNEKHSVWDIIADDFRIVRELKDKTVVKRHGADSVHSGYIFKDNGCLFLHSTGTIYPHETQLTPFTCFTYKKHNGDFSAAAKQLYADGYGSRIVVKDQEPKERIKIDKKSLEFPIDVFPEPVQNYLIECKETLNSSIDYMGCVLLWCISLSIGNSLVLEVKRGWQEKAVIWMSLIGKPGIGKTPSISNIIYPFEKLNNREIHSYIERKKQYDHYGSLSKKEQKEVPEVEKPIKQQFIANDITIEALVDLHQEAQNGLGIFKDELAGWLKDMNRYRPGSDLEFWLSSWSGKAVYLNRLTRPGSFVQQPFMPVLGGIQPSVFNSFYTEENKDNGFMDRMLISYPDLTVEKYNENEMSYDSIQWFSDTMVNFYEQIRHKVVKKNTKGHIIPVTVVLSAGAKKEWVRIFNEITKSQNSDSENEYMKSMLPKQKSYIPRFALLLHVFSAIGRTGYDFLTVSQESMLNAEKLSKYFISMAKKIKVHSVDIADYRTIIKANEKKPTRVKIERIYAANKEFNRTDVSELLGVSRQIVQRYLKEIQNKNGQGI